MEGSGRWPRLLVIVGLVVMVIGALDPLEGALVILPGSVVVALGARFGKSRHRALLRWALVLIAVGVGALWGLSARGGIGPPSGHSYWWGILLLPYPVGWIMGLVGAVRTLRDGWKRN